MDKLPKDRNGNTIEQMTYGYYAIKGKEVIKVYSEPYKMGIFLYFYKNYKIYNQVSKDTPKRAKQLLKKTMEAFIQDSFDIILIEGTYKVRRDPAGYYLTTAGYTSHRYARLNKKDLH